MGWNAPCCSYKLTTMTLSGYFYSTFSYVQISSGNQHAFLLSFSIKALEMIHDIREAFNDLLEENSWMDDETRSVARQKVTFCLLQSMFYHELINKNRKTLSD